MADQNEKKEFYKNKKENLDVEFKNYLEINYTMSINSIMLLYSIISLLAFSL